MKGFALRAPFLLSLVPALIAAQAVGAPADDPRFAALDRRFDETKAAMMSDPAKALRSADAGLALARTLPDTSRSRVALATAQWLDGEAHIYLNEVDRATPLIAQGLANAGSYAPGTKLQGDLLRSRGALAVAGGRAGEALLAYHRAYRIFVRAGVARSQAIVLQDIGQIYSDAGDYDRALRYFEQSADTQGNDPSLVLAAQNERGEVLRRMGRLQPAATAFGKALRQARLLGSTVLEMRVLANLAEVQAGLHELDAAQDSIRKALAIADEPEAEGWRPTVLGAAATVSRARGDLPAAARLLDRMFAGVDLTTTNSDYTPYHQLASDVYGATGRPDLALAHLRAFERLNDAARALTASNSSQLLAARFDFSNQNLKISSLKQGQLQRDIRLEKQRSVILGIALGASGVVFVLLLAGFFSLRRSRNEVRSANVTLTGVNLQLEKALRAKTEFLAMTSHEIRTPLNGILGMTQVMLAGRGLPRAEREQVEVIHGAGEAMKSLVDDILDVAKMETGEVAVVREPVPLARMLGELRRLWTGHAGAKGLSLSLTGDAPATILGDEARLRQVLSNLLSNAVKFTERGGVTVAARTETGPGGETLVLTVEDTGIGIAIEQQAMVFESFHQVDAGTTRQFSGTGLGLTICRKLVTAMGGTVTLNSVPGQGSTFTVRLPLERVPGQEPERRPAGGDAPTSLSEASVLLVERNLLAQGAIRALLEPRVRSLDVVATGEDAADAIERGVATHLLIEGGSADLPGLTPVESLRTLIARAKGLGIHSTLLFTPGDALPLAEAAMLGASQIVPKPVGGTALLAAMGGLYDRSAEAAAAPTVSLAISTNR